MRFTDYYINTKGNELVKNVQNELIIKLTCPDQILYLLFKPIFLKYIRSNINEKYLDQYFKIKINSDNSCKDFLKKLEKYYNSEEYKNLNVSSAELFLDPLCTCNHHLSEHSDQESCKKCNKKCLHKIISHPIETELKGNFVETSKGGEKMIMTSKL